VLFGGGLDKSASGRLPSLTAWEDDGTLQVVPDKPVIGQIRNGTEVLT
jgi:hypothetical protein